MPDAEKVRRIYNRQAARYDSVANRPWVEALRADLFGRARGDVLELGVGTGATFPHYPAGLTSLTGLDISEGMLGKARPRAASLPFLVTLKIADFQTLPFPDASFDTVTSSLALCGIPDPARLFADIRRLLRPGGQLLALEHIPPAQPCAGSAGRYRRSPLPSKRGLPPEPPHSRPPPERGLHSHDPQPPFVERGHHIGGRAGVRQR